MAIRCNVFRLLIVLAGLFAQPTFAHPASTTSIVVSQQDDALHFNVLLPIEQLQMAMPDWPVLVRNDEAQLNTLIIPYLHQHLTVSLADMPISINIEPLGTERCEYEDCLRLEAVARLPANASLSALTVAYDGITHRVRNHRTLLITDLPVENTNRMVSGAYVLSWSHKTVSLLVTPTHFQLLTRFFQLGLHHILEGLDHLAFLLCLIWSVIAANLQTIKTNSHRSKRQVVTQSIVLISLFTVGHTLSLALSALNIFALPAWVTEVGVAASVLIAAVTLAIRPQSQNRLIVLLFGLIHGMAFSEVLHALPVDTSTRLFAVAGFNVGVEVFQILLAAVTVPALLAMTNWQYFNSCRMMFAGLIAIAACIWLTERWSGTSAVSWIVCVFVVLTGLILLYKTTVQRPSHRNPNHSRLTEI